MPPLAQPRDDDGLTEVVPVRFGLTDSGRLGAVSGGHWGNAVLEGQVIRNDFYETMQTCTGVFRRREFPIGGGRGDSQDPSQPLQ